MTHTQPTILIAAGASGGHLFPALAVAEELRSQGAQCIFVVGGEKFVEHVTGAGFMVERLPASPFNVGNPLRKIKAVLNLMRAWWRAVRYIQEYHPSAVFGTGGYATVATVLAAKIMGVPVILHEQNVLPGRANRLLCRMADTMILTFKKSCQYLKIKEENCITLGNPVRQNVLAQCAQKRPEKTGLRVLIMGGSQGAAVLSQVIPKAIARLPKAQQKTLFVQHQARPENAEEVVSLYDNLPLAGYDVTPFIQDMGAALAAADLVISRAGTGAVVETSLFGRAAIYVPLTLADGHQMLNAQVAEEAGAAVILSQDILSPETLLPHLESLLNDDERREDMEERARQLFPVNAAQSIAATLLNIAQKDVITTGQKED